MEGFVSKNMLGVPSASLPRKPRELPFENHKEMAGCLYGYITGIH